MQNIFTKTFLLFLLFFSFHLSGRSQSVVINEIMSSNKHTISNIAGAADDWIELYNTSEEDIDLQGYFLSDNPDKPKKWAFPAVTIAAKSRLLVWASERTNIANEIHADFKISKEGESIVLSAPNGNLVDQAAAQFIPEDVSYGRYPDGGTHWHFFEKATPDAQNANPVQTVMLNEIMASNKKTITNAAGKYEDWIELYNHGKLPVNLTGFYLSDKASNPLQWQFPEVAIEPGDFLLVWAADAGSEGELFTVFKLGKEGEDVLLSNMDGHLVDRFNAIELGDDESYGRYPNGGELLAIMTSPTPGTTNVQAEPEPTEYSGIAEVHINTGGIPITSKEEHIVADMQIRNSATSNYPKQGLYEGKIGIRGRGNTSWGMPKKPYKIELLDENNEGIDAAILDMPTEEDWALIANYSDKSLMRNYIAYDLSNSIGVYAPRARFVDFYMNEEYMGNYLLTETIKRGTNRVPIKKLSDKSDDQKEPTISGGYLLELSPAERMPGQNFLTTEKTKLTFEYKSPKEEGITAQQIAWITKYLNDFEEALFGPDFADPEKGYAKYIDSDSFINWILINELARNNDAALHASVYIYKDRNDKLMMGPIWDFDIAFGNINYNSNWETEGWYVNNAPWFKQLLKDKHFAERYIQRWQEIKLHVDELPVKIDATAELLKLSAEKNFERWSILGQAVWPNYTPVPETYQGEVDYLKNWITARAAWIDNHINQLRIITPAVPYSLACEPFEFTEWSASSTAGAYPAHFNLLTTSEKDPTPGAILDGEWNLAYNLTKRSRLNGLGEDGISFINTSDSQDNATGYLGAAMLSLNTEQMKDVAVSWTGGTVAANNRIYALRMQYRVGGTADFRDVLDADGNPIEYVRNTTGHSHRFEDILLPSETADKPLVQVLWRYYQVSTDIDGSRAELRLDDILVKANNMLEVSSEGELTVCAGETVTIKSSPGYNEVVWQLNGQYIEGATGATFEASESGNYSYTYATDTGCTLSSPIITVTILEQVKSPTLALENGVLITDVEGVEFIWTRDGEQLEIASESLDEPAPGTYTVQVVSEAGCISEISAPFTYTITSSGKEYELKQTLVYPNPSQGRVFIAPHQSIINAHIIVTDVTGKKIYEEKVNQLLEVKELNLTEGRKGLYFINIRSNNSNATFKLLMQ